MELTFAGRHQVGTPAIDRLNRLPDPQQQALRIALGLSTRPPADRFLVGPGVLSLALTIPVSWSPGA